MTDRADEICFLQIRVYTLKSRQFSHYAITEGGKVAKFSLNRKNLLFTSRPAKTTRRVLIEMGVPLRYKDQLPH